MSELLELNPEQKKAFAKLKKAYKDCEKLKIGFYNCYGTIGAFDTAKIESYNDEEKPHSILNRGQNQYEFRSVDSWADDTHYFQPNPKIIESYSKSVEGFNLPEDF